MSNEKNVFVMQINTILAQRSKLTLLGHLGALVIIYKLRNYIWWGMDKQFSSCDFYTVVLQMLICVANANLCIRVIGPC